MPVFIYSQASGRSIAAQETDAPATSISGRAVETQESQYSEQLSRDLRDDPALRGRLTDRILVSSLALRFTSAQSPASARDEIDRWIQEHPLDAAHLAVGLAKDDAAGNHEFEQQLYNRVIRQFELNPGRHKGLLGILMAAGGQSKLIIKQDRMSEEEQRELLKRLFEGKGGAAGKTPTVPKDQQGNHSTETPAVAAGMAEFGFYDRLSAENPTGYSPHVAAFQSDLNVRRVPGAPRLIETGKLDYPTLVFPRYLLRFDIDRLQMRLKAHEDWVLQRFGKSSSTIAGQNTPGRIMNSRLARRREFLIRAERSLEAFGREAEKTRDPARITRDALQTLGSKQKETARWITAASIEEDVQRLESQEGFWTEELKSQIHDAPVSDDVRRRYRLQGDRLLDRLKQVKQKDLDAIAILESPSYPSRRSEFDKILASAGLLRSDLSRTIDLFSTVPYRLNASWRPKPAWRRFIDRWARKLIPRSGYVGRLDLEERDFLTFQEAFADIAAGSFPAAQKLLADRRTAR